MAATSWRRRPPRCDFGDGDPANYSTSLTRGAVIVPLWEGAGTRYRTSQRGLWSVGTDLKWNSGLFGPCIRFYDGVLTGWMDFNRVLVSDWKRWSVGVVFRTPYASTGTLWSEGTTVSGTGTMFIGTSVVTAGDVRFRTVDDAGTVATFFSADVNSDDGNWHVLVAREMGPSSRDLWFDGASVATNTTTLSTRTTDNMISGKWVVAGAGGEAYGGDLALLVLWPRRSLTDGEVRRWSADPFGVLPRSRSLFKTQPLLWVPSTTVAAGGWVDQVGGSTDLHSPLADENAATYVQSPANPSGQILKLGLTDLSPAAGDDVVIEIDAEQV